MDFLLQSVQTNPPILKLMQTTNSSHPYQLNVFDDQINYQEICTQFLICCDIYSAWRIATNNSNIDHCFPI